MHSIIKYVAKLRARLASGDTSTLESIGIKVLVVLLVIIAMAYAAWLVSSQAKLKRLKELELERALLLKNQAEAERDEVRAAELLHAAEKAEEHATAIEAKIADSAASINKTTTAISKSSTFEELDAVAKDLK
jgi:flagellar basal body-associated protein FliL